MGLVEDLGLDAGAAGTVDEGAGAGTLDEGAAIAAVAAADATCRAEVQATWFSEA